MGRPDSNGKSVTFEDCAKKVLRFFKNTGINQTQSHKVIMRWNWMFHSKERWSHPRGSPNARNRSDPPLFQLFPEAKTSILQWCHSNIRDLSCKTLHSFVHDTLIPDQLLPRWRAERIECGVADELPDDEGQQKIMFLKVYGLSSICLRTVLVWMHHLGMKYANKSKSFYVDGHERRDVVESRARFVYKYLREWEPYYCHRFVRLTKEELATAGIPESECLQIEDVDANTTVFEVHEDRLWYFKDPLIQEEFNGKPRQQSIRAEPDQKRLIIIGQDECIFHQYLVNQRAWIGPLGEQSIDPKTIGEGLMISAFKSRDFGFGHKPFSEEEVIKINKYRRNKTYVDRDAAILILGSDKKDDFPLRAGNPNTPFFLRYLLIGKSNEGYWSSAHMAVQYEDVVDCCMALYGDECDFLFLFDHSCGHDRKPPGALDAKLMNLSFGGAQPHFNPSKIEKHEGYLGDFDPELEPGDVQTFVFGPDDEGPFNLTLAQREAQRHDKDDGGLLRCRNKTWKELGLDLVRGNFMLERNLPKQQRRLLVRKRPNSIFLWRYLRQILSKDGRVNQKDFARFVGRGDSWILMRGIQGQC